MLNYIIKINKDNHKINVTSLKEDKIHTLFSQFLTENYNESQKIIHLKLKEPPFFT